MSTEHLIYRTDLDEVIREFQIYEHSNRFDLITEVKSVQRGNQFQSDIWIEDLEVGDLENIIVAMTKILVLYHPNEKQVLPRLLKEIPELRDR